MTATSEGLQPAFLPLFSFLIPYLFSLFFPVFVISVFYRFFFVSLGFFFSLRRFLSFFPFFLPFFISVDRLPILYFLRSFVVSVVSCRLCIILLFRSSFLSFVYFQLHCSFLFSLVLHVLLLLSFDLDLLDNSHIGHEHLAHHDSTHCIANGWPVSICVTQGTRDSI